MRIQVFWDVTLCCQISSSQKLEGSPTLNFKGEAGSLVLKSFLHFIMTGLTLGSTICLKKTAQLRMAVVDILLGIFHRTS